MEFSFWAIVSSVLVFLGIPLLAGLLSRIIGERTKGRDWYENTFLPRISPLALIGLLYTIVLLFSLQGDQILSQPWTVARVAIPLLCYFVGMFAIALVVMFIGWFVVRGRIDAEALTHNIDVVGEGIDN